jgi:polynucleotide 5'-hydroxyl-kinase GRC3/NOL9
VERCFQRTQKGRLGVLSYDYQAPLNVLGQAINGMVVALVEVESREAYGPLAKSGSNGPNLLYTPEGLPCIANPDDATVDPRYSQTIGLVLIRGITKDSFHILTPIAVERIEESKRKGRDLILLHGKFDTPDWAYKEDLYNESDADKEGEDSQDLEVELKEDTTRELVDSTGVVEMPWIEVLKGHEKRPLGSKVWRVRRDLGKNNNG